MTGNRTVTTVAHTLTVGGVISQPSGTRTLTKAGVGTLVLNGASTYTGRTYIKTGTVKVNTIKALGTASSLGAPLLANGTISIGSNDISATLIYTGSGDSSERVIDLAGSTGGATIQNDGSGALTLSSAATNSVAGIKTLTLQGSNTGENTMSGAIVNSSSGATAVTKAGAGKWVLSGTSTFTGSMAVQEGTLSVATVNDASADGPLGNSSSAVTLGSSSKTGTLQYTGGGTPTSSKPFTMATSGTGAFQIDSGTLTLTGLLNGSGALTKTGTGTLVFLTTTETYSGATTVSAGKLLVNSATASGSAVTVAPTATLGGTGTVAGTVAAYGILSPGNSPGTLYSGSETWNGGGSYTWEIANLTGTAGTDWDKLAITGSLNVQANNTDSKFTIYIQGNPAGFSGASTYKWLIASTTTGVQSFSADKFTINTSGFTPDQSGGQFVISTDGNNVYLQFGHVTAGAVGVSRAWGTYLRIPVSTVLAQTSGGTGDRSVTGVTSSSGDYVLLSGSEILFAPAANVNTTRYLSYTVADSSTPTAFTANGTITVAVTNAVGAQHPVISVSGSSVTATFFGVKGFRYQVQKTTSIAEGSVNWQPFGDPKIADLSTGKLDITDTLSNGASAYYRLVQAPE